MLPSYPRFVVVSDRAACYRNRPSHRLYDCRTTRRFCIRQLQRGALISYHSSSLTLEWTFPCNLWVCLLSVVGLIVRCRHVCVEHQPVYSPLLCSFALLNLSLTQHLSPLHVAAQSGQADVVSVLLADPRVNANANTTVGAAVVCSTTHGASHNSVALYLLLTSQSFPPVVTLPLFVRVGWPDRIALCSPKYAHGRCGSPLSRPTDKPKRG